MIAAVLSLMLLAVQAAPPAAPPAAAPPATKPAPATPPAAEKPAPPSARLEATMVELKGKTKATFTAKLGPPDSVRLALDGEVLIWVVKVQGATVCGANAAGSLVCSRQGDGDCMVVAAFDTAGGMNAWRNSGLPAACEKAADLFAADPVTLPKLKPGSLG